MEQRKIKIKVVRPKDGKVTIELTEHEAAVALAWMEKAAAFHADELRKPNRNTRRALKRGEVSRAELREYYQCARNVERKLMTAAMGITEEDLDTLEKFIKELDKDEK